MKLKQTRNLYSKAGGELTDHVLQHQSTAIGGSSMRTGCGNRDSMDGGSIAFPVETELERGSANYNPPPKKASESGYGKKVGIHLPPGTSTVPPRGAVRSAPICSTSLLDTAGAELMDHVLQHQSTSLGRSSMRTGNRDSMDGGPASANYNPPPKKASESGYGHKVGINVPPSRGNGSGGGSLGH